MAVPGGSRPVADHVDEGVAVEEESDGHRGERG